MTQKINNQLLMRLIVISLLFAGFLSVSFAQQSSISIAAATDVPAEGEVNLITLFQNGGWAMYPLLLLSIATVGITIYNFMMIREQPFMRSEVIDQLKPQLHDLDFEKCRQTCNTYPMAVTNIINAGLNRIDEDEFDTEAIEQAMEEYSTEEMAGPYVLINYLSIIASVSPMVGLLGTVSGMVKAFNSIKQQGMGKPELLAGNISEALITTASGLIVAIPAMIFYFYFKNKYGKLTVRVTRVVGDLYYTLVHSARRQVD